MKRKFKKIIHDIVLKYQDIKFSIFYWSPWGRAIVHEVWHRYKKTYMYTERVKYFGRIEAAKMFSISEYRWIKFKCYQDEKFVNRWLYNPWGIIAEISEEDSALKPLLFQEDN